MQNDILHIVKIPLQKRTVCTQLLVQLVHFLLGCHRAQQDSARSSGGQLHDKGNDENHGKQYGDDQQGSADDIFEHPEASLQKNNE